MAEGERPAQRLGRPAAGRLSPPPSDGWWRRRWPTALAVCAALAGGIGILAHGLRPAPTPIPDRPEAKEGWQGPVTSQRAGDPEAPPAASTPAQLVAEAKQLAERVAASYPTSAQALALVGRIYYSFGDVAKAEQSWEKCLTLNPEFAEAWSALGEAAWEHGRFERAASHLAKAVAIKPGLEAKKRFFLADSLMNLGRAEEAAGVLDEAARDRPLPPFGLFLLAHAQLELGRDEKALKQFEALLAGDPTSPNVHFGLARAYARLGQAELARKHREEYAKLKRQELADGAQLRSDFRKVDWGDARPLVRECYLNAGRIHATHGSLAEAEKHWLRALELDPQSREARTLLAALYWQQGRREEAVRTSRDVVAGLPAPEGP